MLFSYVHKNISMTIEQTKKIDIEDGYVICINSAAVSRDCFPWLLQASLLFDNRLNQLLK